MEQQGEHPAVAFEAEVERVHGRARAARGALVATVGVRVATIIAASLQNDVARRMLDGGEVSRESAERIDLLNQGTAGLQVLLLLVTGVLFLRWIYGASVLAERFGERLTWRRGHAVWAFIIPIVSLFRPYRVVLDLHDAFDPDRLPPPPPRPVADETTGYREVRYEEPPPARTLPHAYIGAWWGLFVASNLLSRLGTHHDGEGLATLLRVNQLAQVLDAVDVVAAVLAVTVVAGIDGRLRERFRRMRHNPPEVLAQYAHRRPRNVAG